MQETRARERRARLSNIWGKIEKLIKWERERGRGNGEWGMENGERGTGAEARHLSSGLAVCALIIGQTALNFQVFTEAKQNTNKMQQ